MHGSHARCLLLVAMYSWSRSYILPVRRGSERARAGETRRRGLGQQGTSSRDIKVGYSRIMWTPVHGAGRLGPILFIVLSVMKSMSEVSRILCRVRAQPSARRSLDPEVTKQPLHKFHKHISQIISQE